MRERLQARTAPVNLLRSKWKLLLSRVKASGRSLPSTTGSPSKNPLSLFLRVCRVVEHLVVYHFLNDLRACETDMSWITRYTLKQQTRQRVRCITDARLYIEEGGPAAESFLLSSHGGRLPRNVRAWQKKSSTKVNDKHGRTVIVQLF